MVTGASGHGEALATATLLLFGMMWPPDTLRIRQHREKRVFADTSNGLFRRSGARANFLHSVGNRRFFFETDHEQLQPSTQ
jgi:hypothetical protein